jgi:hypothetical protein
MGSKAVEFRRRFLQCGGHQVQGWRLKTAGLLESLQAPQDDANNERRMENSEKSALLQSFEVAFFLCIPLSCRKRCLPCCPEETQPRARAYIFLILWQYANVHQRFFQAGCLHSNIRFLPRQQRAQPCLPGRTQRAKSIFIFDASCAQLRSQRYRQNICIHATSDAYAHVHTKLSRSFLHVMGAKCRASKLYSYTKVLFLRTCTNGHGSLLSLIQLLEAQDSHESYIITYALICRQTYAHANPDMDKHGRNMYAFTHLHEYAYMYV